MGDLDLCKKISPESLIILLRLPILIYRYNFK